MSFHSRSIERARIKKKWIASRACGPTYFAASLLVKRLIRHCWACDAEYHAPSRSTFIVSALWRSPLGPDFAIALDAMLRVFMRDLDVSCFVTPVDNSYLFELDGPHYITPKGDIRRGLPKK